MIPEMPPARTTGKPYPERPQRDPNDARQIGYQDGLHGRVMQWRYSGDLQYKIGYAKGCKVAMDELLALHRPKRAWRQFW